MIKQLELTPVEATAYFWVKTIKDKIREMSINTNDISEKELEFFNDFSKFTDVEWRKLYIELCKFIDIKVKKYSHHGLYGIDDYHQDTAKYYHKDINEILSYVSKKEVPDIRLAGKNKEDLIIATNPYGANKFFESYGMIPLDKIYDYNYILSGDKKELELYNLVMSVIVVMNQNGNHSIDYLRKVFCNLYLEMHDNINIKELEEDFNRIFNQIHDKGLLEGVSLDKEYNCKFENIDLIGIEPYMKKSKRLIKN